MDFVYSILGTLLALTVFFFIPWLAGLILRKTNSRWYERKCREYYLNQIAKRAIKKAMDDYDNDSKN